MKKSMVMVGALMCALSLFFTACSGDDKDNGDDFVAVTNVTLDQKTVSVTVGNDITLTPTIEPTNATNKKVEWLSSNKEVATVTDGKVTAVSIGEAKITATSKSNTDKSATCTVTVKAKAMVVTLSSGETITVKEDGTATLTKTDGNEVTVTPSGTATNVTYTLADGVRTTLRLLTKRQR